MRDHFTPGVWDYSIPVFKKHEKFFCPIGFLVGFGLIVFFY